MRAASALGFDGAECWYDYEMQPQWRPSPLICEHKAALASISTFCSPVAPIATG